MACVLRWGIDIIKNETEMSHFSARKLCPVLYLTVAENVPKIYEFQERQQFMKLNIVVQQHS